MQPASTLSEALGGTWQLRPLNASSFCRTFCATQGATKLFVKHGNGTMLPAEAEGLRALAATRTIRVPDVVLQQGDVLALEWLDFRPADAGFGERFGRALRELHDVPVQGYGWPRGNFIGATPQPNTPSDDWLTFFAGARLRPLAGPLHDTIERVIEAMPRLLDDGYAPRPALIHGDLWSGNWGMLTDGSPVVYDPAVSRSDPEAELAMMELFGAPPAGFRQAYPVHAGYARRRPLYQLYHLLNHMVLFGGGYEAQARRAAAQVLAAAA